MQVVRPPPWGRGAGGLLFVLSLVLVIGNPHEAN